HSRRSLDSLHSRASAVLVITGRPPSATLFPYTTLFRSQETPALERSALDYVIDGDQELRALERELAAAEAAGDGRRIAELHAQLDRKSTRLNSSHVKISYAVFCLKKKKQRAKGRRTAAP